MMLDSSVTYQSPCGCLYQTFGIFGLDPAVPDVFVCFFAVLDLRVDMQRSNRGEIEWIGRVVI